MKNDAWNEFYEARSSYSLSKRRIKKFRTDLEDGDFYVTKCIFIECQAIDANGGAISVSSSLETTKLLVEKCLFRRCRATFCGAAISFNTKGNCIISGSCCFNCSSEYAPFSNILCSEKDQNKNSILDSSVSCCLGESEYIVSQCFGSVLCSYLNCSFNTCKCDTIWCNTVSDSTVGIVSFSSFIKNIATQNGIVSFDSLSTLSSCNIISNEQKEVELKGIICSKGTLEVKDSYILENIADNIFYGDSESSSITVNNCVFNEDVDSKRNDYVIITNSSSSSFETNFIHFSIKECRGYFYKTQSGYYLILKKLELALTTIITFIISLST